MSTVVFNSGIPTEPDVKRLFARFGVPAVGTTIHYDSVSAEIGLDRDDSRFRTVTDAWRRALERQHNVIFKAIPNVGFAVMDPESRILHAGSTYKHGLRRISKGVRIAELTDASGLKPESARVRDHLSRVGAAIRLTAATEARQLKYPASQPTARTLRSA